MEGLDNIADTVDTKTLKISATVATTSSKSLVGTVLIFFDIILLFSAHEDYNVTKLDIWKKNQGIGFDN